ncbi:metallophosphoesterase [Brevibacillus composti]|uniref:Phosphoesterase n=1 Tax=Brevibacillus composti TaxID=2796470 RepID=A0A7T5JMS9_9BACL|nr:metallophosphoesterase [Brevibacillus composti]QQE73336.1 metallophosphoesterase [Brevibacillus composti]QUO40417.1 metallophosphoesterase [Brevibacillus composti]
MGILILSDSHGLVGEVKEAVERHRAEAIFHCGDFCVDPGRDPFSRMLLVTGNCDSPSDVPTERQTAWKGLRILQTHGHLYGVKKSLLRLHYRAEETGANVVLFGHSHVPGCTVERNILFLNPGSLQLPRGYDLPTYVYLEQTEAKEEGVTVQVTYFDHRGNVAPRLGGTFFLRS